MRTQKQIEASRRNGRKSKGPKTLEGKERAKKNSTRHGLANSGLVTPEEWVDAINERFDDWASAIIPHHDIDSFLVKEAATNSVACEFAQKYFVVQGCLAVEAAFRDWEDDRRMEALELFSALARDPAVSVERLARFKQGAELLMERWEELGAILEDRGDWTAAQRSRALDMLGVMAEMRDGPTPLDAAGGKTEREVRRAVVAEQLESLRERIEDRLRDKDEDDRSAAEMGMPDREPPGVKLARRYMVAATRRLTASLALLKTIRVKYYSSYELPALQAYKAQEEAKERARIKMGIIPVPPDADLTQLRATRAPAPPEPEPAPANEPIVLPPYEAIPPRSMGAAPAVEPAPVAGEEKKTKKE